MVSSGNAQAGSFGGMSVLLAKQSVELLKATFFHGVACEFVKCELDAIGLDCAFVPLQVDQSAHDAETWDGIKRRYWRFDAYHLPIASHKTLP